MIDLQKFLRGNLPNPNDGKVPSAVTISAANLPKLGQSSAISCISVLIAAANSSAAIKSCADYVCDGVNDEVEFRQAQLDIINLSNAWNMYSPSPVMSFGDYSLVWFDGITYHCYYMYDSYTKIGHATSADGKTWIDDVAHKPVLSPGAPGTWDSDAVGVMNVWKEGANWYALYRGNYSGSSKIGLATSLDGVTWTKHPSNPVISFIFAADPAGIIKVGSTYYLYTNFTGGDRQIDIFTSTDLVNWTMQTPTPLLNGARFCCCPFVYNGYYYLIVSRYIDTAAGGALELWRDKAPTFKEGNRELVGVIEYNPTMQVDTPTLVTTTIQRDTFPNNQLYLYYSLKDGLGHNYLYLAIETNIAAAIAKAVTPKKGIIELDPNGIYSISPGIFGSAAFELVYDTTLDGNGAIIRLKDGYNKSCEWAIAVFDGGLIQSVILDGNKANNIGVQTGLLLCGRSCTAKLIASCNWSADGLTNRGNVRDSSFFSNGVNGASIYGVATDCRFMGNARYGARVLGGTVVSCEAYNNEFSGFWFVSENLDFGGKLVACTSHDNSQYGILNLVDCVEMVLCEIYRNKFSGIVNAGKHTQVLGGSIHDNYSDGVVNGEAYLLLNSVCIHDNAGHGVRSVATDFTAISCEVYSQNGYGLAIRGRSRVEGCNLHDNIGYASRGQISIDGANCMILGNIIEKGLSSPLYGIYMTSNALGLIANDNYIDSGTLGRIYNPLDYDPLTEAISDDFMNLRAASNNYVHAAVAGDGTLKTINTGITNPDVPRNIVIVSNGTNNGISVVTGIDAKGLTVTETITINPGGQAAGIKAFAKVISYTVPATLNNTDTLACGIGNVLGLSQAISSSASVFKVKRNNADISIGTVDAVNGTVVVPISNGDNVTIYYKRDLNILV